MGHSITEAKALTLGSSILMGVLQLNDINIRTTQNLIQRSLISCLLGFSDLYRLISGQGTVAQLATQSMQGG